MTEVLLPAHGRRHRALPQQNLPRWNNGTDFHALTVVPIPYRSAYGLYVYMSSLTVKMEKTRNVETKYATYAAQRSQSITRMGCP